MKLPYLTLGQNHLKCSSLFTRSSEKDKYGIMLKVIIRMFDIRLLWGLKLVPIGRIKGR